MSLRLNGSQADIEALLRMLGACLGLEIYLAADGTVTRAQGPPTSQSNEITQAFDQMITSANGLTITLGRGQGDVLGDNYAKREIDLDDVGQFPSPAPPGFPDASTRCEFLAHVFAEYNQALQNGHTIGPAGFPAAHQAGIDAQNKHRAANGQSGNVGPQTYDENTKQGTTTYSNGATTSTTVSGGNITGVAHTP